MSVWHGSCGAELVRDKRRGGSIGTAREKWAVVVVVDVGGYVCRSLQSGDIPCCIREPTPNQKLLRRVKLFSTTSEPGLQGWASYHS